MIASASSVPPFLECMLLSLLEMVCQGVSKTHSTTHLARIARTLEEFAIVAEVLIGTLVYQGQFYSMSLPENDANRW